MREARDLGQKVAEVMPHIMALNSHLYEFQTAQIHVQIHAEICTSYPLAAAIALFLAFWFGAVWELPPVYSVVMLADSIDRSYEQKENEPPLPHAEDLSIEDYAAKVAGVSPGKLAGMLQDKGYQVSDYGETIKAVAERHSVSPGEMLKVLAAGGDHRRHGDADRGGGGNSGGVGRWRPF